MTLNKKLNLIISPNEWIKRVPLVFLQVLVRLILILMKTKEAKKESSNEKRAAYDVMTLLLDLHI